MNELVEINHDVIEKLNTLGNCRITKPLKNGKMAILQIVDPEDVPVLTKILRLVPGKVGKFAKSVEAAFRVGLVVYRNSMRKKR